MYDIAGLIKGAAQGTGLGNQFLNAVLAVDLVVHLVRCFEATDGNVPIAHVEGEGTSLLIIANRLTRVTQWIPSETLQLFTAN